LVNFSVNINHCQSHLSILLLLLGLYATVLSGPTWLRPTAIVANLAYFFVVWVWSPLTLTTLRVDVAAGGVLTAVGLVLWVTRGGQRPSVQPPRSQQAHRAGHAA
jgi:hypothetical protein